MRLKNCWPILVLLVFWIFVAIPFFGSSFIPTHDGEYHIIRFFEFYKVLSEGTIIPRWAPGLNSGYGVPLFNFNYPFPNYVGAFFHIFGSGFIESFKLTLISGYGLALFFCFSLFRKRFSSFYSLYITLIFATIPYWFVDLTIRGSVGEVWAIAWMMGVLASIEWDKPRLMAIGIGLLIISHNILAMLFIPVIFGYLVFVKKKYLFLFCIGILAATYFWLPALGEKQYVTGLNSVTFSDHFPSLFQLLIPSWGSGFSAPGFSADEMSQQIGVFALFVFGISLLSFFRKKREIELQFYLIVFAVAVFFMLEITIPVWKILTPLQFLQYPWRLLSVVLIATPFLSAVVMRYWKPWAIATAVLVSILFSIGYIRPVLYQHRDDSYYLSNKEFTDGTNSLGNSFSTIWSTWKKDRPPSRVEVISGNATIGRLVPKLMTDSFVVTAKNTTSIQVSKLYYPGWQVFVDGKSVPILYQTTGTLLFSVPAGYHQVMDVFNPTPLRFIANWISILSIIFLVMSFIKRSYAHRI